MKQPGKIRVLIATGAVAGALMVASTPSATAAPGQWTKLSTFDAATNLPRMENTIEPTAARFGPNLSVVWSGQGAGGGNYYAALVDGAGNVTTPSHEILSNWSTLTGNPRLVDVGGQRFLGFSGLQSTTTGAPYTSGAEYYATSGDGNTFTLGAGSLSSTQSAYAAYGNDIVSNAGTPVWVGNAGTTSGVSWHSGIAATDPAPAGSDTHFGLSGCCAYSAAGARDEATGAVYSAFYSNSSGTSESGIQVGQILPTQGAFAQAPGSVTVNDYGTNSISPDQRIAMTGRAGGGVFVAYGMGYPTLTGIRVHEVVSGRNLDVLNLKGRIGRISLTSDPAGRVWLVYAQDNRIKAVHTNTAATQFGATGSWGAPSGTDTIWHTTAVGSSGGLDIVVSSNAGGKINVWHTQALRTLSIKGAPDSTRRGHAVVFTVTDAGDPVAGVHVKFCGHTATTNASGRATLDASGHGRKAATAKKTGYNPGSTSISVR